MMRPMVARRRIAWCACAVVALAWAPAAASPSPASPSPASSAPDIALDYDAPAGCPDRAAYLARLAVHGRGALADAPDRRFLVHIDARDGQFAGTVTVRADGETRRDLAAADCAALVDALALVTALALDPRADAPAPPPPPTRSSRAFALGAAVAGALGVGPDPVPSIAGFGEVALRDRVRLRLGVRWGRRATTVADARATFSSARVHLDACPRVLAVARGALDLGACAGLQLGVLAARGAQIADATSAVRPWLAPAGLARARWRAGRWFAELEVAVAVPLVRDRFYFAPDVTVHRAPAVVGEAALGAGVTIP